MSKTTLIFAALMGLFNTAKAQVQPWPVQIEPRMPRAHVVQQGAQAELDPYRFCYYEQKAYSEGTYLKNVGKCQLKANPDPDGRHRLYWEPSFHKQK